MIINASTTNVQLSQGRGLRSYSIKWSRSTSNAKADI